MILFTFLLVLLLALIAGILFAVGVGGIAFVLMFGDVIVCVCLIVLVVRFFTKRKK